MFLVEHINFGTTRNFDTFEAAKEWTIKACFEAVISLDGMLIGKFSPISGFWRNPSYF